MFCCTGDTDEDSLSEDKELNADKEIIDSISDLSLQHSEKKSKFTIRLM